MRKIFLMTLLAAASAVYAEMKHNPDSNTLWIEDGKNIKTAKRLKIS